MARLADVAELAGVSKATASRALAHPEMVAPPTRQRVLDAAGELGFRYNRAARALVTGRTGLTGLVLPTLANPFYAPLVLGAQQAAEELDRHLLVAVSEHSPEREQRLLTRLAEQVDGFVMVAPLGTDADLARLAEVRPMVLVDRKIPRVPAVVIDTASGVADLAGHLLALGHRRIGYVCGPSGTWADRQRRRAVGRRVDAAGAELHVVGPLPPTYDAGLVAAAELPPGVTGVIAYNSLLSLGMLHSFATRGVRVPGDISLASADDLAPLRSTTPSVTALELPVTEAGEAAVARLHRPVQGTEGTEGAAAQAARRTLRLPARVLVRDSTGPPG